MLFDIDAKVAIIKPVTSVVVLRRVLAKSNAYSWKAVEDV